MLQGFAKFIATTTEGPRVVQGCAKREMNAYLKRTEPCFDTSDDPFESKTDAQGKSYRNPVVGSDKYHDLDVDIDPHPGSRNLEIHDAFEVTVHP